LIGNAVGDIWPDLKGRSVLGLGYAVPYLDGYCGAAKAVIASMPDRIGVLPWPRGGPNAACLSHETELPLADRSVDRILMVHSLESVGNVQNLLRETWRVLEDGGRLLVVVPNRGGVWARTDRTPFGSGQPYSMGQINRILRNAMFTPQKSSRALFIPPSRRRFVLATAPAIERIGRRWLNPLAGVSLIEASKTIYAGVPESNRVPARRYLPVGGAARTAAPGTGKVSTNGGDI
jgi:SAM-dependent methyltransferase